MANDGAPSSQPSAAGVSLTATETITGSKTFQNATGQTFRQAATQDGILLRGRAGGTSSYTIEIVPTVLTASRVQTAQDSPGTIPLIEVQASDSFRNKLINGDFRIWQLGTSFTGSLSTRQYTADQGYMFVDGSGVVFNASQQAFTLGAAPVELPYFYRFAVTTAGSASTVTVAYGQPLEDVRQFAGKRIVVSFWAKADATRTYTPRLVQNFGTGGSPSASVTTAGSGISVTTGLTQYVQAFNVPSISGKVLGTNNDHYLAIEILGPNNTVQTFDLSMIEVRPSPASEGTVATPWELRPLEVELLRCYRYVFPTFSLGVTPAQNVGIGTGEMSWQALLAGINQNRGVVRFPVEMRAAPSITFYNPAAANAQARDLSASLDCTSTTAARITSKGFAITSVGTASSNITNEIGVHFVAKAQLP